jgi:glyoxylase-like metal-dependent hydrolase (beta-lactamase superfamily II)
MNTVTVLIEGYIKAIEGRQLIPGVAPEGARHVAGTVVLIRGEQAIVVADPGMVTDRALIVAALAKEGVAPHEVTHVFVSHHHPDHTVNIALFPNAEVVNFWAVYKGDLWRDHADGYAIAPGITVLRTPGHTEEDASLVAETAEGTYVLTHLWWLDDMTPRNGSDCVETRDPRRQQTEDNHHRRLDYSRPWQSLNWLQVLGTAERSQVDQGIRHQLHAIVSLLDAFKAE